MNRTILRGAHADELIGATKPGRTSYDYLFILREEDGWSCWQTTVDNMWFGIWTNAEARHIFTFDHGERRLFIAHSQEAFAAEIAKLETIYGSSLTLADKQFTVQAGGEVTMHIPWEPRPTDLMFA